MYENDCFGSVEVTPAPRRSSYPAQVLQRSDAEQRVYEQTLDRGHRNTSVSVLNPGFKVNIGIFDPKKASVDMFLKQIRIAGSVSGWTDEEMAVQALAHLGKEDLDVLNMLDEVGPMSMARVRDAFKGRFEPADQRQTHETDFLGCMRDPLKQSPSVYAFKLRRKAILAYPGYTKQQLDRLINTQFVRGQPERVRNSLGILPNQDDVPIGQLCSSVAHYEALVKGARHEKAGSRPVREVQAEDLTEEESDVD